MNRLVANGEAWRTWPGPAQRSASHTIPFKVVSNIIVLGQGNRRSPDGAGAPGPEPSDGTYSAGSNGGQHPRAQIKSLQPKISFEAKRQLITFAEALALERSLIACIIVRATPAPDPLGLEVEGSLAGLMTGAQREPARAAREGGAARSSEASHAQR
jgi:hypothetical protein